MLKVSRQLNGKAEIFYSIQGEGINIGKPAVFLRLAYCNLSCIWCDTKYTWDWIHYSPTDQVMNVSNREIAIEIKKYKCNHLVITGGEPLLQQSKLVGLLKMLGESSNICVELETNGTILPRRSLLKLVNYWTVSPKLSSSENLKAKREVRECYELFQSIPTGIFKYAVKDENDLAEIRLLRKKYKVSPDKIILMPQTKSREDLLQKSPWLVEACKQHGYRFSTRLHILLWGNRRGV